MLEPSSFESHLSLLVQHHQYLIAGKEDDSVEDAITDQLEVCWEGMSDRQRELTRLVSSELNRIRRMVDTSGG